MGFVDALLATPAGGLSPLSRYTVANGVLYLVLGLGMFVGAGPLVDVVAAVEGYALTDVGLVRVAGMAVAFIGWFYIFGGRTGAASFGLSTVVDRVLLPLFLVPLWWIGELPAAIALAFAVLDPVLGIVAYAIWRRQAG